MITSLFRTAALMILLISFAIDSSVSAQTAAPFATWVDTMDVYARTSFLPAKKYNWTWQNAALLNAVIAKYESAKPAQQAEYLAYVKDAMAKTYSFANGQKPNAVASGLGMAFLYRITKEEKYKKKCDKIYSDYLKNKRTKEGAVSHIALFTELWDDTVFMVGEFLISMYLATGEEKYIDELVLQLSLHRDKLRVEEWGLWVHGWDKADWGHCLFCSQVHWSKNKDHRSAEMWGRGNGWVIVTLSDALKALPVNHPHYAKLSGYLNEMLVRLPELQDKKTGHWYQLPVLHTDPDNFIESSCTAMFGYGITAALRLGIVAGEKFENSAALAYTGLRQHSISSTPDNLLTTQNICSATCIGDKKYYFKRKVQKGKAYGLGSFIKFGLAYETYKGWRN